MKYTDNNTYWKGCGKTETTIHCCLKCKNVHLPWKIIQQFIIKLNIQLLYDSQIPLLGIYLGKMKIYVQTKPAHKCPKQFHPKSQKKLETV